MIHLGAGPRDFISFSAAYLPPAPVPRRSTLVNLAPKLTLCSRTMTQLQLMMAPDNVSLPSRKRTKRQDTRSSAGDGQLGEPQQPTTEGSGSSAPSTRTGLACEACRLRKTRCVGFPICSWCQQRRQTCVRHHNSQTSP
jgi:hypothetical protein